jgi:hypothetical protein
VYINANGYIAIVTGTGADATTNDWPTGSTSVTGAIGVFVGCSFVNTQGQVIFSQYYPSGTTGVVQAFVVDDPMVLFQAQLDGTATQAAVGANTFFAAAQIQLPVTLRALWMQRLLLFLQLSVFWVLLHQCQTRFRTFWLKSTSASTA